MMLESLNSGALRVALEVNDSGAGQTFRLGSVELLLGNRWQRLLDGAWDREFATSYGSTDATDADLSADSGMGGTWRLSCCQPIWEATETIGFGAVPSVLVRRQTYRIKASGPVAVHPGFRLSPDPAIRYTYPLRLHEQPLAGLPAARLAVDWALPFPFHVWHGPDWVALYGLDKRVSPGTLELLPASGSDPVGLRIRYPDSAAYDPERPAASWLPEQVELAAGTEISLTELIAAAPVAPGEEPLLVAVRLAVGLLLDQPPVGAPLAPVADRIAAFYPRCGLWEPNALGPGRGWFSNMWVRTQTGPARKRGEMSGYFDLGWGEGIAVETMLGLVRHWRRTGCVELLPYVDEMSRNIERFRRGPGEDQPYLDRADGVRFGDFLMDHVPGQRIWTHSLGHTASQLLQLYEEAPEYPLPATRQAWWTAAGSIARFFARQQRPDGDLHDIFDEQDREVNRKPHRITARAVVCGLWTRFGRLSGDHGYVERALRLFRVVAPQLARYEYTNQMLDGLIAPGVEYVDGEAAYYVLEGLVPLYAATGDEEVLAGCRQAVAFGACWTYLYDLPLAHCGVARGGQCCRMDDFPLLYPIGPAKAVKPLLELHALTGDLLYEQLAGEAVAFLSHWQLEAPGEPWDGGMLHALGQYCGRHWGPELAGQVDTGMATGNSLAAIEAWLARPSQKG
jgi:hypothetical protein